MKIFLDANVLFSAARSEKGASRHFLYGAYKTKANFLLTLDKRHFFTSSVKKIKKSFKIMRPGDFIQMLRKE